MISALCRLSLGYAGKSSFKNCTKCKLLLNNSVKPCITPAFIHFTKQLNESSTLSQGLIQDEEPDKLYKLIEVEVRGNDKAVLRSYSQFTKMAAEHLGVEIGKCWTPQKAHHERFTVLKSIHVNKKNMVQYEFRTYFRFMQFHKLTGSTADTFLEYIQRNLPEGVAMKVTKVGLEKIPDHIKPTNLIEENRSSLNIEQLSQ